MIEKEAGKEPAEGGGGGGSHRLGDAQEMRAVVLAGFGGLNKLRVTRKAMPEPQDGELKIRVKAWSSIRVFLAFSLCALGAPGAGVAEPRRGRCAGKSGGGRPLRALPRVPESPCGRRPAEAGEDAARWPRALSQPDLGVTGGDCELSAGRNGVDGGAQRPGVWEIARRGALRRVGQLNCREREFGNTVKEQ